MLAGLPPCADVSDRHRTDPSRRPKSHGRRYSRACVTAGSSDQGLTSYRARSHTGHAVTAAWAQHVDATELQKAFGWFSIASGAAFSLYRLTE